MPDLTVNKDDSGKVGALGIGLKRDLVVSESEKEALVWAMDVSEGLFKRPRRKKERLIR